MDRAPTFLSHCLIFVFLSLPSSEGRWRGPCPSCGPGQAGCWGVGGVLLSSQESPSSVPGSQVSSVLRRPEGFCT